MFFVCAIILLLFAIIKALMTPRDFSSLQSAIEKLTHDYLNLFHFPPLIKVREVSFLKAAFIAIGTCHCPRPNLLMSGTVV
jgi:hypothetical protein